MIISKNSAIRALTGSILVAGLYLLLFHTPALFFSLVLVYALSIMIQELKNMISAPPAFIVLLPWYLLIPCCIILYFNHNLLYKPLLYYLFCINFSFDSASYITGKFCSKFWNTHKIIPSISPGKSWEGFLGGCCITTLFMLYTIDKPDLIPEIILITLLICITAFAGDIFESWLKRAVNLKDSGTILPGHGGLLDRFDSILATTYIFLLYKDYLIKLLT